MKGTALALILGLIVGAYGLIKFLSQYALIDIVAGGFILLSLIVIGGFYMIARRDAQNG